MTRRDDSGVSALDLLTVLLILGALSSITVPVFLSSTDRVQAAVCASNRAAIMTRAASYQNLKGVYPATMTDLVEKAYFAKIPECPGNGVYVFNALDTGGDGDVYCSLHFAGAKVKPVPVAAAP